MAVFPEFNTSKSGGIYRQVFQLPSANFLRAQRNLLHRALRVKQKRDLYNPANGIHQTT